MFSHHRTRFYVWLFILKWYTGNKKGLGKLPKPLNLLVGREGFEPSTIALKVRCSTNWANGPAKPDNYTDWFITSKIFSSFSPKLLFFRYKPGTAPSSSFRNKGIDGRAITKKQVREAVVRGRSGCSRTSLLPVLYLTKSAGTYNPGQQNSWQKLTHKHAMFILII